MAFSGYLKQSTAATIMLGPFVDEDDGKTAETGLTIAQADVRLSKNAGNMAQKNESTSCTHDEIGIYSCPLDATDTNTLGLLDVMVHESGALPVHHTYQVVTANWYDTMCSTDQLDVNVTNIEGSDPTDQIRDAIVDDATQIDASALNTLSGHDPGSQLAAQTDVTGLNDPTAAAIRTEIDNNSTQLAAIVADTAELQGDLTDGGRLDLLIDAILADTAELQSDDVPSLIAALNDLTEAQVNAQVDAAIETYHLDHLLAADYDPSSKPGTATALLNELVENDGGVSRFTENALEQAPSGTGGDATAANQTTIINAIATLRGADSDTLETLSDQIDGIGGQAGSGATAHTVTVNDGSNPISGADVWITSDQAGNTVVASGETDGNGQVTFQLDAGTYYMWVQISGYNFTNPTQITVS
jgi:hypothetical protein